MPTIQGFQAQNASAITAGTAPQRATGAMPQVNLATHTLAPGQSAPTPGQVHANASLPNPPAIMNGGARVGITAGFNGGTGGSPTPPAPGDPTQPGGQPLLDAKSAGYADFGSYAKANDTRTNGTGASDAAGAGQRAVDDLHRRMDGMGLIPSIQDEQAARNGAVAQFQAEQTQQQNTKVNAQIQEAGTAASDAAAKGGSTASGSTGTKGGQKQEQAVPDPVLTALQGMATTPEGQLALAQYQKQTMQSEQDRKANDQQLQDANAATKAAYDKVDKQNADFAASLQKSADDMKGLIKEMHDQNQAGLEQQQKAASDNLAWQAHQQERALSKQEIKAHESMVAQIALGGGFGQDASLREVAQSDANFESKIIDVQNKLGVDQTDLAAKYSGLYIQNNNDYLTKSITNTDTLHAKLLTIHQEENSSTTGRASADASALKDWHTEQNTIRKERVTEQNRIIDKMQTAITAKATADRNQQNIDRQNVQTAETLYLDAAKAYPGGTIPQSILDNLNKAFPDMKFAQGGATLAQINGKRSGVGLGGSSGGYQFNPTDYSKSGAPPTLANFLASQASTAKVSPTAAMTKQWTDEWNAKMANYNKYDPKALEDSWNQWSSKLPKAEFGRDQATFNGYMKKNDYQGASDFIDSLKPEPNYNTTVKPITDAQQVIPLLSEINGIYNQLAIEGHTGPYIGKALSQLPSYAVAHTQLEALSARAALLLAGAEGLPARSALSGMATMEKMIPSQSMTTDQALAVMKSTQKDLLNGAHLTLHNASHTEKVSGLQRDFDATMAQYQFGSEASPPPPPAATPARQTLDSSW